MASISQMFATIITDGIKAAKAISDVEKKAVACAELAKALAMTGLVAVRDSEVTEQEKPVKESLRAKPTPKQETFPSVEEPVEEEPVVADDDVSEEEVELTEEWTNEMIELFAEELEFVQNMQEEYEEETINDCIKGFSEGQYSSLEDISPLNIKGFVKYVQMLEEDGAEE